MCVRVFSGEISVSRNRLSNGHQTSSVWEGTSISLRAYREGKKKDEKKGNFIC